MRVQTTTLDTNEQYLASVRAIESVFDGVLAQGNGTTDYAKVKAGTPLARSTSTKKLHPAGHQELNAVISAANIAKMDDAANFYVGDTVSVVSAVDAQTTIVAGDNPSNLVVRAKKSGLSLDIVVSGTSTAFSSSYDQATGRLTINSATDGGGSATSSVGDIADEIAGHYGHLIEVVSVETDADLCVDVGPTTLGPVQYEPIASARTVTAVDKTSTPNTVTFDGAAITAAIGDHLIKDLLAVPVGILDQHVSTVEYIDLTAVASDRTVPVRYEGDVRASKLVGDSTWLEQALTGDMVVNVGNEGALIQPEHAGFVIKGY